MKLAAVFFISLLMSACTMTEISKKKEQKVQRERTEWTNIWITEAAKSDKPRVLLVGDSIVMGYYNSAANHLKKDAYTARLSTSLCVADYAYIPTLQSVLIQNKFDFIHFNNGLHGFAYTEEQYKKGYEETIKFMRKIQPEAAIIVTLTTPVKKDAPKAYLNKRVDKRNQIARELAEKYGLYIDDLHTPMKNHPEYHRDAFHYKRKAIEMQGRQVAEFIKKIINKDDK